MYKKCPNCEFEWPERADLLTDRDIELVGYQVNFTRLEAGIILFNHKCKGTLAVLAGDFTDLHKGPIFEQRLHGTDRCPGHCLHEEDFRPCPEACECAYVRNVLHKIRTWPKNRTFAEAAVG